MRGFLLRQDFALEDLHCIEGEWATRAAIVAGFAALLEATRPGDVVVVYYAGHGGLFPDRVGARLRPHPILEPMDIADSDEKHFNGLLGAELRLFIRALARLCDNVTAIFDCCHASGLLSTDQLPGDADEARDRAEIDSIARRAAERIARRRAETGGPTTRSGDEPETTGAVRLVASSASERAYVHPERPVFLFTDTLVSVLVEFGLARGLTWEQIVRIVRARVQEHRPEQRPGVEGARERRPFTTDPVPTPVDHFHVQREDARLRLTVGSAAGIRHGEQFELVAYAGEHDAPLGVARATGVKPFHADLKVARGQGLLPQVMFARRVQSGVIELAARLGTSARSDDRDVAGAWHAALAAGGDRLLDPVITDTPPGYVDILDGLDPSGGPGFVPQCIARLAPADADAPEARAKAVRRLRRWAGLAAQLGHPGLGPLAGCYALTWGRVVDDRLEPLIPGALLPPGSRLGLCIYNPGTVSALHVQVFRVRADRCIDAWREVDGGLAVKTGHELPLQEICDPVPGLPGPAREWLVLAIGDGAFELGALVTPRVDRPPTRITRSGERRPGEASRVELIGFPYLLDRPSLRTE